MKTKLTTEQSQHLIELGVPKERASKDRISTIKMDVYPVFTLTDLLKILPKIIETEIGQGELYMNYKTLNGDIYAVAYYTVFYNTVYYHIPTKYNPNKELIDALYELTIWCIENEYLKIVTE